MKLTVKEKQVRMKFVLDCVDTYEAELYEAPPLKNGFPLILEVPNEIVLYLYSSQIDGEKATYCGVHFRLIQLEITKEQLHDQAHLTNEINQQKTDNQKAY